MRKMLFLTALVSLFACSAAPAQQTEVAARIGNRNVTVKELDDRWRADDAASQSEATQKLYDGRRAALDAIISDTLLAEAAKAKGLTADAYEAAEVGKRLKPVTDADVVTFYQGNINQMQGRSLDLMAPAINRFLTDQQRETARQALFAELRKAGPEVRVMFDAPRREVTIAATDPSIGRATAPVTLIEFSDFQCPFCQRVEPTLKKVRDTYGDKIRIVWKDFPLTQIHPQAFKASEAAHCAGDQGKYWEYHDRLFGNQEALQPDDLKKHAGDLGLNATTFAACLDSSKYGERVRDGVAEGTRLGVNSTPTIYVNGRMLSGAQPYETFVTVIDEELSRSTQK
ncbi:MAG TPA: thioredoxin domain-containing protein [Vicinamibacterales bacterium]|nr:thioredoxin domain-containing protein [Vicinamibacterales bacterium]